MLWNQHFKLHDCKWHGLENDILAINTFEIYISCKRHDAYIKLKVQENNMFINLKFI